MSRAIAITAFVILGPLAGIILDGLSRIISARLQGRIGPPILQPFYDFMKLMSKSRDMVPRLQYVYIVCYLFFTIFSGGIFFAGGDVLLFFFSLTLANTFLILAVYSSSSPFSHVGVERGLIEVLSYEPPFMLAFVGLYIATGSFQVDEILQFRTPLILFLPGCFLSMIPVLCIKLSKSPFDLASTHHPHQELVKGMTTDFSAITLGLVELAHWYKLVYLLAFIMLFFQTNLIAALILESVVFLAVIFIDNLFSRFTYQQTLKVVWSITLILGFGNIVVLYLIRFFTTILAGY
jgi:ech hydrogenase subunit B